jgi:hypothetical protein
VGTIENPGEYLTSIERNMLHRPTTPSFILALSAAFVLSACGGSDGGSSDPVIAPQTPVASGPVAPAATADTVVLFATDGRLKLTGLGSVSYEAYPIALFNDGRALSNTMGLLYPAGLEAHRAKYPSEWTQWRKKGADVEVLQSSGAWTLIANVRDNLTPLAPSNVRLTGVYEAASVSSSLFMSIIASTKYTFTSSGGIGNGSFVVGNSTPPTGSVTDVFATTPDKRGTYTIDGYRLNISYDSGVKEEHVIVVNQSWPRYIFIDGVVYTLK